MIVSPAFAGQHYGVLGLARSGLATVRALHESGATVMAWDMRDEARKKAAPYATIEDPVEHGVGLFDAMVVSPGVPLNRHPMTHKAEVAGVPIIGDIELFALARESLPDHKVVGITGTNGKSTTTALVHHILKSAGCNVLMGGNIGLPILEQTPLMPNDVGPAIYVLELSSYQIDLSYSLDCDVAALLNITPDHLDRYDGFEGYAASKARLFGMQSSGHKAVFADADACTAEIAGSVAAVRPDDVVLTSDAPSGQGEWPALQGPHNAQNVAVAVAIVEALGIGEDKWRPALSSFGGLPHRMEYIGEHLGFVFVNDSKATNPASTAPALAAFPNIRWICGGQAKTDSLDECAAHFGNVRAAYTIGEAGPLFARLLADDMPVMEAGTMEQAVEAAMADGQEGDVILLSPACASFDQFSDFEDRGNAFRAIVASITGKG